MAGKKEAAVRFWGTSSGCVWNYWGLGDSPFPVIAGAWDGGVGLILVVGG